MNDAIVGKTSPSEFAALIANEIETMLPYFKGKTQERDFEKLLKLCQVTCQFNDLAHAKGSGAKRQLASFLQDLSQALIEVASLYKE